MFAFDPKNQVIQEGVYPFVSKAPIVVVMVYYVLGVFYSIYTQRYYFADGSYFFVDLLENGFVNLKFDNRLYAHYITEFLPVGAIKVLNIRDYSVLSYLFGINLYLPEILSLLICHSIVPKDKKHLMIFPLISLFGVSMNSAFFIVSEAHVISNIFWPILIYVTLKESYSLKDVLVLLGLTIIFARSYESAFFLGTILGFVSFSKAFKSDGLVKSQAANFVKIWLPKLSRPK